MDEHVCLQAHPERWRESRVDLPIGIPKLVASLTWMITTLWVELHRSNFKRKSTLQNHLKDADEEMRVRGRTSRSGRSFASKTIDIPRVFCILSVQGNQMRWNHCLWSIYQYIYKGTCCKWTLGIQILVVSINVCFIL